MVNSVLGKSRKFSDFRKMLDEMGKSIDACTVSTPDHTHAVATMKALQMGKHVARNLRSDLKGRSRKSFRYRDLGSMATIGRSKAVASVFGLKLSGLLAWLVWLFVHLLALVGFRNRLVVLLQWAWSYVTFERNSRLITGEQDDRESVM